jgi:hypothetical protein
VATSTTRDYRMRRMLFQSFCDRGGHILEKAVGHLVNLEVAILEYLDLLFMEGKPLDTGTCLVAALSNTLPFKRVTMLLPRVRRALQG